MNLTEYQLRSRGTYRHVCTDDPIVYPTLGLVNEAGEVAGKIKKIFRDQHGTMTDEDRVDIKYELGDVLWYLTQIATNLDITMDEVAESNLEKLSSRQARGVIGGSGDDR